LFFFCCVSITAPRQRHWRSDEVPAKNNKRRREHLPRRTRIIERCTRDFSKTAGSGLGTTIKYPRRTTGAAAGNSLGTTLNYLRGTAGNDRAQR
jgi:hypothetical protein